MTSTLQSAPRVRARVGAASAGASTARLDITIWVVLGLSSPWWVSSDGLELSRLADQISWVGRLAAVWAGVALLVQLLALARLPFLERRVGHVRLAQLQHYGAIASVVGTFAHVGLTTAGYAASTHTSFVTALATSTSSSLVLAAGVLGGVSLAATWVLAPSLKSPSRYRPLLSACTYGAVLLALGYHVLTGDHVLTAAGRWTWWVCWSLAVGATIYFRLIVLVLTNVRHRVQVAGIRPGAPGLVELHMFGRDLDQLPVETGQFFVFRFLALGLTRSYRLPVTRAEAGLCVQIDVSGADGDKIVALTRRSRVLIEGPLGGRRHDEVYGHVTRPLTIMWANGNTADLMELVEEAGLAGRVVTVVLRADTCCEVEQVNHSLAQLSARYPLTLHRLIGPSGGSWMPAALDHLRGKRAIRAFVPDPAGTEVVVEGPARWTGQVLADLRTAGVVAGAVDAHVGARAGARVESGSVSEAN